jgi:hypothetical protein
MGAATGAALSAVGIAIGVATTSASFAQAAKAKKDQRTAELKAAEAMDEARKKLDVNYYKSLSVKKEPYELEREALLSAGAQALEAGVESERGAGAVAGRIQMAQNEQQGAVRTAMGRELTDLEKLTAGEDSRLRDIGVQLDLDEVAGAQLAAANNQEQFNRSIEQGIQGVSNVAQQAIEQVPLYLKKKDVKVGSTTPANGSGPTVTITPTQSNLDWANPLGGGGYAYPAPATPTSMYPNFQVSDMGTAVRPPQMMEAIYPANYQPLVVPQNTAQGFKKGGVMIVGGEGDDDIALVEAKTGKDTGKRVSKGEMIVVSKDNVSKIKKAVKSKDKETTFKVVEAQLKQKPVKKKLVKK